MVKLVKLRQFTVSDVEKAPEFTTKWFTSRVLVFEYSWQIEYGQFYMWIWSYLKIQQSSLEFCLRGILKTLNS